MAMRVRVTKDWQEYALHALAIVGAGSVVYGVSLIYVPAAYIVGGLAAVAVAVLQTMVSD